MEKSKLNQSLAMIRQQERIKKDDELFNSIRRSRMIRDIILIGATIAVILIIWANRNSL
jgi:hypothetical protein